MLRHPFQRFLLVSVTLCFLAQFLIGKGSNLKSEDIVEPTSSCWDGSGAPMLGAIPNIYNCSQFLMCHIKDPLIGPEPLVVDCQPGHEPLFYDFMNCRCDYKENAVCYNDNNPTHRPEYFKCACKWNRTAEDETRQQCPNVEENEILM